MKLEGIFRYLFMVSCLLSLLGFFSAVAFASSPINCTAANGFLLNSNLQPFSSNVYNLDYIYETEIQNESTIHPITASHALSPGVTPPTISSGINNNTIQPSITTYNSQSWAGFVALLDSPTINGTYSSWNVQYVPDLSSDNYSVQWVGIGGYYVAPLIQVGTASLTFNNILYPSNYFAWFECTIPNTGTGSEITILNTTTGQPLTVKPNDIIQASIHEISGNDIIQTWNIYVHDVSQNWQASGNFTYPAYKYDGAFIDEDPNNGTSPFAPFGVGHFGSDFMKSFSSSFKSNYVLVNKTNYSLGSLPIIGERITRNSNRTILASPNPITPDNTSFGVTYDNLTVNSLSSTYARSG